MRIAVTGGAGFIGTEVVRQLGIGGHDPVVIDRYRDGGDCDIRTSTALTKRTKGCDSVIHLAGLLGTSELFDQAGDAIDVNVRGTLNVLDACRAHAAAFVGITVPDCWPSVYQATKLAATRLASAYHHAHGVPVTHIRAFNVYGEGQKVGSPQKIIPTFASRSWAREPMPIWGDGSQTVDLVHVSDVATNLVAAATRDPTVADQIGDDETFDAGTGMEFTVLDVARMVGDITGSTLVEFLPMRPGELDHTRLCASEFGPFTPDEFEPDRFRAVVESYHPAEAAAA